MTDGKAGASLAEHNPLLGLDIPRLEKEMESYHTWLDEHADDAYRIAEQARSLGFDPRDYVEIPRASDLAGRTEKLLVEHLEGYEVADDIRKLLQEHDRETTSILIAQSVSRGFREQGFDLEKSIDVGLRVGLAVLTEAVLVAPLEGISEVALAQQHRWLPIRFRSLRGPDSSCWRYCASPCSPHRRHDPSRIECGALPTNRSRSRARQRRIRALPRQSPIPPTTS